MTQQKLKLSKDIGDIGDQICPFEVFIYHIPEVKVGSTYNLEKRIKQQGYELSEVEVLMRVLKSNCTYNHIWSMEQVLARQLGLRDEHDGNRIAVNRVRASKEMSRPRSYILTQHNVPNTFCVDDASTFEGIHGLSAGLLSRAANPKARHKFVTVDGVKFTARYAD